MHCLAGRDIRPTADRLREAIFNILGETVKGARVLDLFAGTGALAIEALSRGARSAVLIDRSRAAIKLMRRNLSACRLDEKARVICWDIRRNLKCLSSRPREYDLVFMDPPYGRDIVMPALDALLASGALAEKARLVVEHAADDTVSRRSRLRLDDQRRYGRTRVTFLAADADEQKSAT